MTTTGEPSVCAGVDSALEWASDIAAGKRLACRWLKLAIQRHFDDVAESADDNYPFYFDAQKAERVIRFIELLPHTKGSWAAQKQRLILSPWQRFFVAMVFGWLEKETGFRRFRVADLYVPRKNGKSALAAGIGLYCLSADGEYGAEVYSGATTERQAWEVFRPAKIMSQKTPAFCQKFGVTIAAKSINVDHLNSRFEAVVGKPGDGSSPSVGIVDEYHEHKDDTLFDTFLTGMGARNQPLMLIITTAGDDIAGPCHAHLEDLKAVLSGHVKDERLFGLIFTIDDGDDWTNLPALQKANPNHGVSISLDFLKAEQQKAVQSARYQSRFKTKHLNLWVADRSAFFNMEEWARQKRDDLKLSDFEDSDKFGAVDLSSKYDLAVFLTLYRKWIDGAFHYFVVAPKFYLPRATVIAPDKKHYQGWREDDYLTVTDGEIIDYDVIKNDVVCSNDVRPFSAFGFDPWSANQFAQILQDKHYISIFEMPQRTSVLSEPMKWIEAFLKSGRLHHDGNPILSWCISNIVAKTDANDNVFPRKPSPEKKIDGGLALIMALALALKEEEDCSTYISESEMLVL